MLLLVDWFPLLVELFSPGVTAFSYLQIELKKKSIMKKYLFYLAGIINLLFAVLHMRFGTMFNWGSELAKLSSINNGIMLMLNVITIYILLAMAFITFKMAGKPDFTSLERWVVVSFAGFSLTRTAFGPVFFDVTASEIIVWICCLVVAGCYLVPVFLSRKS
jgi:hypothetical protein